MDERRKKWWVKRIVDASVVEYHRVHSILDTADCVRPILEELVQEVFAEGIEQGRRERDSDVGQLCDELERLRTVVCVEDVRSIDRLLAAIRASGGEE